MRYLCDDDCDIRAWWREFQTRPAFSWKQDEGLLMILGVSTCFSANHDGTVRLPFDQWTGQLVPEGWGRWLAWDPVRIVAEHAQALRGLRAGWIDAGSRDERYLDVGAEAPVAELAKIGVTDVRFELFDVGHLGVDFRSPQALDYLAERPAPLAQPASRGRRWPAGRARTCGWPPGCGG